MRRFHFRLAAEVFHCSVAEMLERVSSSEMTEWVAWYRVREGVEAAAAPVSATPDDIRSRFAAMKKELGPRVKKRRG